MNEDWDRVAKALDYADAKEMWKELYQRFSIQQLSKRFSVSTITIRRCLFAAGIPIRQRGGPNNRKIANLETAETLVKEHGVMHTAMLLNVDPSTIYKALYYKRGLRTPDPAKPQEEKEHPDE